MPSFRDRVKDSTSTTGTGAVTLSGTAPSGFQSFNTAFGLNTPFQYAITGGAEWETGIGYLSAATTLVRDVVLDGSAGVGTLVAFSAGSKDVFCTIAASWCSDSDSGSILHKATGMAMP